MEMFVRINKKLKWVEGKIIPQRVPVYRLIWSENGYSVDKKFENYLDLVDFLLKEKIYKQERFPECINVSDFISQGFSIYFYS